MQVIKSLLIFGFGCETSKYYDDYDEDGNDDNDYDDDDDVDDDDDDNDYDDVDDNNDVQGWGGLRHILTQPRPSFIAA